MDYQLNVEILEARIAPISPLSPGGQFSIGP